MTYRDLLIWEHPEQVNDDYTGGCNRCPADYGYSDDSFTKCDRVDEITCRKCWDRVITDIKLLEEKGLIPIKAKGPKTSIKDSGDRTEFETGAVRDMHEGKGRCDLMPLDVIAEHMEDSILLFIYQFTTNGNVGHLYRVLDEAPARLNFIVRPTVYLEVAIHFEEGAKKYGDNNWRKGIPVRCYIDSAVRHYLKHLRGDEDERHDRAFCWNILCCIWTCKHHPELNDYAKKEDNSCEQAH